MSGKVENDVMGAIALLGDMFGGPEVKRATDHIRERMGNIPSQAPPGAPPDDGRTVEMPTEPPTTKTPRANVSAPSGSGPLFYCVFLSDGTYSGHSFVSPYQAHDFASGEDGAYVRKLRASDIPEG